jgi:ATP-dependent Lon protease
MRARIVASASDDALAFVFCGNQPPTVRCSESSAHYPREAGVRNLERESASICRKVAVEVVKTDRNAYVKISSSSLFKFLGPPKFRYGTAETEPQIGVATGLAWTELGGELLSVEVTIVPGRASL